jgi:hypothetical protein
MFTLLCYSKGLTGSYLAGFRIFASLCFVAIFGFGFVKPAGALRGALSLMPGSKQQ